MRLPSSCTETQIGLGSTQHLALLTEPLSIHRKFMQWGCFSKEGFGKLLFFKKNLTGPRLIELYERGLLPTALEQFGENKDDWILMEDNDPKHTSKVAKNWKIANDVNRLPWPSQSPDLNPIENVWGVLKINVAKKKPASIPALIRAVKAEWKGFSLEYAQNLVSSMKCRVRGVIDVEGDHLMY